MIDLRHFRNVISVTVFVLLATLLSAYTIYADDNVSGNPECVTATADITVRYVLNEAPGKPTPEECNFTLKAAAKNTPMPDNKIGGKKSITLSNPGTASFGTIKYSVPDVYAYKVTRSISPKSSKSIKKDTSEYDVLVLALSDGTSKIITKKVGEDGKSDLVFTDTIKKTKKPHSWTSVLTGDFKDGKTALIAFTTLITALMLLFFLLIVRPYNRKLEELEEEIRKLKE